MMKIVMFALSYFLGQTKSMFQKQSSALSEQIVMNVRSFVVIILSSVGALALFCSGFYAFVTHVAWQLDQYGGLQMTATLMITLVLWIVSLGVIVYCLRPTTWLKSTGVEKPPARPAGAIEGAVAMLIMDFIKERESRRDRPTKE